MEFLLAGFLAAIQGNGGFERGTEAPEGWVLSGGRGEWARPGRTGERCIRVLGTGADSNYWRSTSVRFEPRKTYRVSFWTRRESAGGGGCVIAGPSFANRDFLPGPDWERHGFAFRTPDSVEGAFLRFGQWQLRGTVSFDDVELHEARPFHLRSGGLELGEGESIRAGRYVAQTHLGGDGANDWRPLATHTAGFNSNRWTFGDGQTVVYRHAPGRVQKAGSVTVQVGYHTGGRCLVEAGRGGRTFEPVGEISRVEERTFALPGGLFPAPEIFVRLRASDQAGFQVHGYRYEADLEGPVPDLEGRTRYLELLEGASGDVEVVSLGDLRPGGDNRVVLRGRPRRLRARAAVGGRSREREVLLAPEAAAEVPYEVRGTGPQELTLVLLEGDRTVHAARVPFTVPVFYAADYGRRLSVPGAEGLGLWWCDAVRKVGRERPLPEEKGEAVLLSAARNEIEAAQIVIRPEREIRALSALVGELRGPKGRIPADRLEVREVAYVRVERPTDATGAAGEWADPLPPLRGPLACAAGRNQPLWIQVRVPEDAAAGDYEGTVLLEADGRKVSIPLRLHVWDFALPRTTHVRSGFGFSPGNVKRYHNLQTPQEVQEVCEKYYRNFAEHRIAPYNPMAAAPIRVRLAGSKENPDVEVDFAEFDRAAARYLDETGFNAFMLQVQGFPGGTFHARHEGNFLGHRQGSPHYERLMGKYLGAVQDHLEAKGWLRKAYVYWFDEPEPRDYPFVIEGMKLLKRLAPKLTRFLTEEPNEALAGHVDLWCPVLNAFDPAAARRRQEKGEEIWWYVCCGPHAPYPTLFIDHDAIELRMWLWMSWEYGVQGILIWETTYWTSPTAFPKGALQDPWADPMSYVSGYGVPEGTKQYWGNGDGRFFYPPNRGLSKEKNLDGPVNSLRWEMLREGIEDYEYFWILRERLRRKGSPGAEKLLKVPPEVFRDLTHFSKDPEVLYRHRRLLAEAIERLGP